MTAQGRTARTPVVLVPGAWATVAAWDAVRETFEAAGHRTDVVELPARRSPVPQLHTGGLRAIDAVVDEALAAHDEAFLVGHSLGGLAALRASRRRSVRALALLMPAPPSGLLRHVAPDAVGDPLRAAALVASSVGAQVLSRLPVTLPGPYAKLAEHEAARSAKGFRAAESWVVLAELLVGSREPVERSAAPTLVVGGRRDTVIPARIVAALAAELEATSLEADVVHAFQEEPDHTPVTGPVLEFLAAHEP